MQLIDRAMRGSVSTVAILAAAAGSLSPATAHADTYEDAVNVYCTSCTTKDYQLIKLISGQSGVSTAPSTPVGGQDIVNTDTGRGDGTRYITVDGKFIAIVEKPGGVLHFSQANVMALYNALAPKPNVTGANGTSAIAAAGYTGSNSEMQALAFAINTLTAPADIQKAGAQLRPEINGGTTQASLGATNQAIRTIQVRADAVRTTSADAGTGISSGETLKGLGVWGQGFGSYATQDRREDVDGYHAATYGLAFGADARVIDPLRVGVSLAYARTNVDDTGSRDGSGQDISSYIASLYGTYTAKSWYVDGALTFGWHDYDATRLINIAGASTQTAKASYAGQQYGAKAEFGYPLEVGRVVVTPLASLAYNRLHQDGYTETGAAAALTVAGLDTDSIRSGLGSKVSATVGALGEWNIRPNARAVWLHEFNGSAQDTTSSYVEGASSFTTSGIKVAREHFDFGIGLDMVSVRNTTISGKYEVDLSDHYISHTGSLQIRTEF